ncbi:MAG: T9SS type A sorting domain-containing protein, partial [Chitinophagaceae bacterium]
GGIIVTTTVTYNDKSLIQNDGKILIYSIRTLDRFNPDGSYDVNFGINGRIVHDFNGKVGGSYNSFALQNDGKIICTGEYYAKGDRNLACLFRCNSDGSLDSSFGINGLDTVGIDNTNYITGVLVQPDGKIVASGNLSKNEYDEKRTFIYRLMPDGGLDTGFGKDGVVINRHAQAIKSKALLIRPDGRLVIGSTYNIYIETASYQLESFNTDGSVDAGFGTNGIAQFTFGEGTQGDWATDMRSMILQPDGKIVCAGTSGESAFRMALCRFNENGTTDETFGEKGGVITPYMDIKHIEIFDLTLQADGKILTSGFAYIDTWPLLLVRYTEDGHLDPTFGENGITATYNPPSSVGGKSVHELSDGKILVTGYSGENILLARYNGDNILAANFKEVKATQTNDAITITWQTLNEIGTKSFTVERSSNATDYAGINTVPAKGVASNYSYTDKNPLSGTSYYRIRENAANGTNTFSPVVKVVFNDNGVISLYPNPAKNTVTVKGLNKSITATIRITDMNGREISKQNFTQSSTATLNIRALAQGSYFVLVEENGKVTKLRMVKE